MDEEYKDYEEYKRAEMDEIHLGAQIDDSLPSSYFLNYIVDKLSSSSELVDPRIISMKRTCKDKSVMAIDGYGFDGSDKSVVLIYNDYTENYDEILTKKDIESYKSQMLKFLKEAYDGTLDEYFDITSEFLKIGVDIGKRMRKDYVDLEDDSSIDRIKLFIITNKELDEKFVPKLDYFLEKRVVLSVWNLKKFYTLIQSGREKEPIFINTSQFGVSGIPCIKAEMSGEVNYDAYLAIVPGKFLNEIFLEHGSRLLEGNVRAFLSTRGKINKGIRDTIRRDPTKFFTYNNGIACTAAKIVLSEDGHNIVSIEDLQIINGGQTTASLSSASFKDHLPLDNIFVPMKLTVIRNDEEYDSMIQNISKYANSQNKVKDSDFFSNHPFHRLFEKISKRIQAPAHGDNLNNTLWYYERSRGKYEQEQFKLTKKSEKEDFVRKYPKNQVIKKEELAKYFTSAELLRPDIVSKGSEKCMSFFAEYIDGKHQKGEEYVNDEFYKQCVCDAIIFKTTDRIVNKAPWYNVGGYKLNIVPYTISKLIASLPKDKCLDYDLIWRKQELYPSLVAEIEKLARKTNEFIQESNGVIVTEYCKKEDTWNKYKEVPIDFSDKFMNDLLSKELQESKLKDSLKDEKEKKELNIEVEIFNLGREYWLNLIDEGLKRKILSPQEVDLLKIAANMASGKVPTSAQAKYIWKIKEKLDNRGVLV